MRPPVFLCPNRSSPDGVWDKEITIKTVLGRDLSQLSLMLTLSLLSAACSGGNEAGGQVSGGDLLPSPPVIRDSAGITIVENAEPQWAPGSEWQVGPLLTSIGDVPGDPAHELYRARDATRHSDGTVAVANSSNGEIRFFNADGSFLRTVGSTGGGPGEFRGASALRALTGVAGDTLIAWDIYGQLVSVFAPDGGFVRSFGLNGPAQQHFFAGSYGDGSLLLFVIEYPADEPIERMPEGIVPRKVTVHRYGVDHQLISSIREIPNTDAFQARWGPFGMIFVDPPFGRRTSISAGSTSTYVSTGHSDEVTVHNQAGELERVIRRTLDPTPVTSEMADEDRARRLREESSELEEMDVDPRVRRMIHDLPCPEFLPPYGITLVDSEGYLWMEEFQVTRGKPADWSVFDPQGVWLGRVTLPTGLEVFEIGSDYILGRAKDELEVERIVVHGLIKP